MPEPRTSNLSPACRRLVETLARLGFGVIEGLQVRSGEPVFDPPPNIIREVRFSESTERTAPRPRSTDFVLCKQVVALLDTLRELGDGTIARLEVRHGLPHRILIPASSVEGRRP